MLDMEIIDALSELKRMHQLNLELLEQLDVTCGWLLAEKIHPPNEEQFYHLLNKTRTLFEEIRADRPKILQYSAIRRKVTERKSDEEVPEPLKDVKTVSSEEDHKENHEHLCLVGLKHANMNSEHTLGFVRIGCLGKAQQVAISTKYFSSMLKLLESLDEMEISEVVVTVETDRPIVIGTRDMGIAIAPKIHADE